MSRTHISCTINGDSVDFLCAEESSLLNALRDEVGLTGVKEGCGTGDCGACSIMLNDRLTCSCLVFAPEAAGATITTVEGIANGDHLHPLQQCFLEGAALQCGICTPGFLVAAKALLERNIDAWEMNADGHYKHPKGGRARNAHPQNFLLELLAAKPPA